MAQCGIRGGDCICGQREAIFHAERYGLIEASTKAGKTLGCLVWLVEQAISGQNGHSFWWVAPSYSQAEIAFRRLKQGLPHGIWQAPWHETIVRIRELTGDAPALVDATHGSVGDPVLEALQRDGAGNFEGFRFTAQSKQQLMEGLAVAIQRQEIRFPDGVLRGELEQFEFEYSRTGVRYAAPDGAHDDCVCALALAVRKASQVQPGAGVLAWMEMQRRSQQPRREDPLPWRRHDDPLPASNVEMDLYAEARRALGIDPESVCARCGGRIGATRVTDGVQSWHPGCR